MFSKKNLYIFLTLFFSTMILLTSIKPARTCTQCDCPIYFEIENSGEIEIFRESLLARMFSLNTSFLHLSCVNDYLRDHPIERDEEGNIIPKI
jgi:hypothetical protein